MFLKIRIFIKYFAKNYLSLHVVSTYKAKREIGTELMPSSKYPHPPTGRLELYLMSPWLFTHSPRWFVLLFNDSSRTTRLIWFDSLWKPNGWTPQTWSCDEELTIRALLCRRQNSVHERKKRENLSRNIIDVHDKNRRTEKKNLNVTYVTIGRERHQGSELGWSGGAWSLTIMIMALKNLLQPLKRPQSSTWHLVITPDPRRYKGFQVRWLPSLSNSPHWLGYS